MLFSDQVTFWGSGWTWMFEGLYSTHNTHPYFFLSWERRSLSMADKVNRGARTQPGLPGVNTGSCVSGIAARGADWILLPWWNRLSMSILFCSLLVSQIFICEPEVTIPIQSAPRRWNVQTGEAQDSLGKAPGKGSDPWVWPQEILVITIQQNFWAVSGCMQLLVLCLHWYLERRTV